MEGRGRERRRGKGRRGKEGRKRGKEQVNKGIHRLEALLSLSFLEAPQQ
jgi:hypothetical protein